MIFSPFISLSFLGEKKIEEEKRKNIINNNKKKYIGIEGPRKN